MSIKKVSLYGGLPICILIIGFVAYSYFRPLPPIASTAIIKPSFLSDNQKVVWGQYGSQAIGLVGYGINNQTGSEVPSPVASTIKVLLTLSVDVALKGYAHLGQVSALSETSV